MTRKKTFILFVPIVVVMVILDQAAKQWARSALSLGSTGADLGLFDFTLVHNQGAAFGMGQGSGFIFIIIAIVICIAALAWLIIRKRHTVLEVISIALIVAGGIGNLIDRLQSGYVVDFINFTFIDFPVFNVADICVTCGVFLFIFAIIFTDVFTEEDEPAHD